MSGKALIFPATVLLSMQASHAAFAQATSPTVVAATTADAAKPQANPSLSVDEIIVTAQKRSENLQDVPIAVSAITGVQLAKAGVTGILDVRTTVPTLNITYSAGYVSTSLRGIGSAGIGPGIENPVAIYVDGVYIASQSASLLSLNNVAQVEVLKGPQGTLFGRNATAGLIQITTRDPLSDPGGMVKLTYANYRTVSAESYVGLKFSDQVAGDIAIQYKHQGDGYGRNLVSGQDVYKVDHDLSIRSKLVFLPFETSRITIIGDYSSVRDSLDAFVRVPGTKNGFPLLPAYPLPLSPATRRYDTDADYQPLHDQWNTGASVRLDQEIGTLRFTSLSAFRKSRTDFNFDYDETSQPSEVLNVRQRDQQFTQELQLGSSRGHKLQWIVGAYYFGGKSQYDPAAFYFNDLGVNIRLYNTEKTDSFAGYGQATYEVLPATRLTVGARYTTELRRAIDAVQNVHVIAPNIDVPPESFPNRRARFNKFTYRISIDHRFSNAVLAYASVNKGFKSGGFNAGLPGSESFRPESIDAYEAGLKTDLLDRRLRVNAAGFYYTYKDVQTQHLGDNGIIGIINGGAARVYGIDIDATARLAPGLTLTGGVGIISPKFTSFPECPISSPAGGVAVMDGSCAGNQLPLASKTLFNISGDYTFKVARGDLDMNVNLYRNGGFYPEADNAVRQPAFVQLSASLKWTSPGKALSIAAFGKNLTNEYVITYETTPANGTHQVLYAPPRTYGVTVGYQF